MFTTLSLAGVVGAFALGADNNMVATRSLQTDSDYWWTTDIFMTDTNCQNLTSKNSAHLPGCQNDGPTSHLFTCSDDGSDLFAEEWFYTTPDCTGDILSHNQLPYGPSGCLTDPSMPGFSVYRSCVRAEENPALSEGADYGTVLYYDNQCSSDHDNIKQSDFWFVENQCLSFNLTTIGVPPGFSSLRITDCGDTFEVFSDNSCQVSGFVFTNENATILTCLNDGNTDDQYWGDDDYVEGVINAGGSSQNFCFKSKEDSEGHGHNRPDKHVLPKKKPSLNFHRPKPPNYQALHEQSLLSFASSSTKVATSSGLSYEYIAPAAVLMGCVMAASLVAYKLFSKKDTSVVQFEEVAGESLHSVL